jgi:hypothetical protein
MIFQSYKLCFRTQIRDLCGLFAWMLSSQALSFLFSHGRFSATLLWESTVRVHAVNCPDTQGTMGLLSSGCKAEMAGEWARRGSSPDISWQRKQMYTVVWSLFLSLVESFQE